MIVDLFASDTAYKILAFPAALLGAVGFIIFTRAAHKKTKLSTVLRVLFNTRIWLHKSSLLDFQYVIAGSLIFSAAIAYLTFTAGAIGNEVYAQLSHILGSPGTTSTSGFSTVIAIVLLYIAYELGYWLDHFLSHKIPFLWEFHKVHHSAKVLTPFTNWRVHPVDTLVFHTILALIVGTTYGLIAYFMGKEISYTSIAASGIMITAYTALYGHLQHSHLWIPLTGWAGRIILSPAHHQIHHSTDRRHFDKNFGAALSLFDWLFGTLYMPSKNKENLTFGIADDKHLKSILPSIFYPFVYSGKQIQDKIWRKRKPNPQQGDGYL